MKIFAGQCRSLLVAPCIALLAGSASTAAVARPFTAADLVALDRISDPKLSPDGRRLIYGLRVADVAANSARQEIWLVDTKDGAQSRRLAGGTDGGSHARWSPDGKGVYFLARASGTSQLWRVSPDGSHLRQVTCLPLDIGSFRLSPDGGSVVVTMAVLPDCLTLECTRKHLDSRRHAPTGRRFRRQPIRLWDQWADGTQNRLFVMTLSGDGAAIGPARPLLGRFDGDVPSRPEGDDSDYVFTHDGTAVIFTAYDAGAATTTWGTNFDLYRVPLDASSEPRNLTVDNRAMDVGPIVSPDGRFLAFRATRRPGYEADRMAMMILDLRTSKMREIARDWDRSPELMAWSSDGQTLHALARDLGQSRIFAVDVASGRVQPMTDAGRVTGYAIAGSTFVYAHEDLKTPAQLYRAAGIRRAALTHHNHERLHGVSFGAFEQFAFQGWNDETVHAYLVKPADFDPARKYPVVLLVHGGPQGSLSNFFDYRWNAQTYAGRGFAVLMIDFHGSKGYGQLFQDAVSNHWGDRPLEDLRKGWAEALRRYAFLDGARACALGASYGGYMINWIASQWKDPWKCLVNHSGIFDYRINSYSIDLLSFMEWENGGTPYERPDHARFNPADYVDQWAIPMLVTHGENDYRVAIEQGVATFAALQRKGVPSEFIYYPDENHRILKPGNSLQWHNAVEDWLRRWTGGQRSE